MSDYASLLRETEEAIGAGQEAHRQAQQVLDSLRSARGWGIYDLLGGGRCDRRGCRCEGEQKFYGGFHRFLNWFAFLSSAKLAHERPAGTALRKNINDMNCQFPENQLIDASDGVELYK